MISKELQKQIEEKKEKFSKMSEEELKKASGGVNIVGPYQEGCESFIQNVMIIGETPKQCAYCMFAVPYSNTKFLCLKP